MKRILSLVASLGLVTLMLGVTTGSVLAWTPDASPACAANGQVTWTVTIHFDKLLGRSFTVSDGSDVLASGGATSTDGQQVVVTAPAGDTITVAEAEGLGRDAQTTSKNFTSTLVCTATVTFHKAITSTLTGPNQPGNFLITLTGGATYSGTDGQTVQVLPGDYTLTEQQIDGYVSADGGGCYQSNTPGTDALADDVGPTVTFTAGNSYVCGFNNQWAPPLPTVTVNQCATYNGTGSVTISGLVDGLEVEVGQQGGEVHIYTQDGTVNLGPGTYWWVVQDAQGHTYPTNTATDNQPFTIGACPAPPVPVLAQTCGGSVSFTGAPAGWVLSIDGTVAGTVGGTGAIGPISVTPGAHTYTFSLNEVTWASGKFAIVACPSPPCTVANGCIPPSPSPSVSPSPAPSVSPSPTPTPPAPSAKPVATPKITPPPTSTGGTGAPGAPSTALFFVLAVLVIGSAGTLLFTRRVGSR